MLPPDLLKTKLELRTWIVDWLARELKMNPANILPNENLLVYGVDSINAMMLVGDLEDRFRIRLSPTLLWDHPTVEQLVENLGVQIFESAAENEQIDRSNENATPIAEMGIAEARQLLERIGELSDSEVDQLLMRLSQDKIS